MRNPWRFSFDRLTGDLLIGDVGQTSWEEVDYVPDSLGAGAGANFGWDCREGAHEFEPAGCAGQVFTEPIFEYAISGAECAITGGYVVRDPAVTDLYGRYLYADFCVGALRSLLPGLPLASDDRAEGLSVANPSTFGEDACGRVYVASLGGAVSRFVGTPASACATHLLTVDPIGTGSGRVTGPGIDCAGDCSQRFFSGQRIELVATPSGDSSFAGWGGVCTGTGPCAANLAGDGTVSARFDLSKVPTELSLTAKDRRIRRPDSTRLALEATPCPGRAGDEVAVSKRGRPHSSHVLDQDCSAHFRVRPRRTATFRAALSADVLHEAGEATPVRIKVRRRRAGSR